jgi:N-methylhydantoinase A
VTDANVVLGRLIADCFLGGEMRLDVAAAREAIKSKIADPLGLTVEAAALGIIRIAVAEMSLAVRSVSVGRGYDPRDFAMVGFGGAGPLHSAEIARELNIPTLVIPRVPGHFSALGMLLADLRHDYVRTYYKPLSQCDFATIEEIFGIMAEEGRELLASEGVTPENMTVQRFLDMRYVGQEFPIQTPVSAEDLARHDPQVLRTAFDRIHDRRYGHKAADEPVEIVNLRMTATGQRARSRFPAVASRSSDALIGHRSVVLDAPTQPVSCPVYDRDKLGDGAVIRGPAAVVEYASTTILFEGDVLTVAPSGELVIRLNQGEPA